MQHGSDRILAAMKRGYTALEYKSTIRKLRAVRPDICARPATSSSASPARPTRTSRKTMKLIDDVGFDDSFSFIFSPRPGTPAADLRDDTPHAVEARAAAAAAGARSSDNVRRISASRVGTVQRMLVEGAVAQGRAAS